MLFVHLRKLFFVDFGFENKGGGGVSRIPLCLQGGEILKASTSTRNQSLNLILP